MAEARPRMFPLSKRVSVRLNERPTAILCDWTTNVIWMTVDDQVVALNMKNPDWQDHPITFIGLSPDVVINEIKIFGDMLMCVGRSNSPKLWAFEALPRVHTKFTTQSIRISTCERYGDCYYFGGSNGTIERFSSEGHRLDIVNMLNDETRTLVAFETKLYACASGLDIYQINPDSNNAVEIVGLDAQVDKMCHRNGTFYIIDKDRWFSVYEGKKRTYSKHRDSQVECIAANRSFIILSSDQETVFLDQSDPDTVLGQEIHASAIWADDSSVVLASQERGIRDAYTTVSIFRLD